jgi:hypothetical protein
LGEGLDRPPQGHLVVQPFHADADDGKYIGEDKQNARRNAQRQHLLNGHAVPSFEQGRTPQAIRGFALVQALSLIERIAVLADDPLCGIVHRRRDIGRSAVGHCGHRWRIGGVHHSSALQHSVLEWGAAHAALAALYTFVSRRTEVMNSTLMRVRMRD